MQIFVRGLDETHVLDLGQHTTLGEVKVMLEKSENMPSSDQLISYCGTPLDRDDVSLTGLGLESYCTLDLTSRLLGGKVPRWLARAGKVRGQTPKVDKQEKKKKKTGRAKRRIQYNRRFVNVAVAGPGRRRGPNSNS